MRLTSVNENEKKKHSHFTTESRSVMHVVFCVSHYLAEGNSKVIGGNHDSLLKEATKEAITSFAYLQLKESQKQTQNQ